jgi:hypothetical protein
VTITVNFILLFITFIHCSMQIINKSSSLKAKLCICINIFHLKHITVVLLLSHQETGSSPHFQETMCCIIQNCTVSMRSELPDC